MAAQKGKEFVLKRGDGATSETFTTVGGFRTNTMTFNETPVDITNKSSADHWRELLRAGTKSMSATGSGVFTDTASEADVRSDFFGSGFTNYQVVVPDFGTFEGSCMISSMGYGGDHDGEVTTDLTIESAGAITFTAA